MRSLARGVECAEHVAAAPQVAPQGLRKDDTSPRARDRRSCRRRRNSSSSTTRTRTVGPLPTPAGSGSPSSFGRVSSARTSNLCRSPTCTCAERLCHLDARGTKQRDTARSLVATHGARRGLGRKGRPFAVALLGAHRARTPLERRHAEVVARARADADKPPATVSTSSRAGATSSTSGRSSVTTSIENKPGSDRRGRSNRAYLKR